MAKWKMDSSKSFWRLFAGKYCVEAKEQFSDGVGYSWIDTLKAVAAESVTDEQLANAKFRFPDSSTDE